MTTVGLPLYSSTSAHKYRIEYLDHYFYSLFSWDMMFCLS